MRVGVKLMRTDKKAGLGWPKGDALTEPSSKHFWGKVSLEERHLLNLTTSAHCLKILSDTLVCSWHGPNSLTWPPRSCMVWPLHLSFSTLPPYHRLLWLISFNMATCSIFPQGLCNKMFPLPQIGSPPIFFFFLACPTWSSGHSLKNHVLQWHCPTPQICAPFRGIDSHCTHSVPTLTCCFGIDYLPVFPKTLWVPQLYDQLPTWQLHMHAYEHEKT